MASMAAAGKSGSRPDFVTALMGDPWLEMEWRRMIGGKAARLHVEGGNGNAERGGRYAAALSDRQRIGNAIGAPQAIVKVIAGGGVADRGELTAQLKYLARDGDLELEEAESDFRGPVEDRLDIEEIAASWAEDWQVAAEQDGRFARAKSKTFHLLVSFPEGTDTGKAKAAAWSFADRLCHSGDYGDEWRNVRAWHEDRGHPHMHLVIDRRGASGRMMKIHPAAEINPTVLRGLQVDTAAEQGIALNDTPRASRGVTRQPQSTREWRAERGPDVRGRAPSRDRYAALAKGFAEDTARREAEAHKELAARLQSRGQTGLADTLRDAARILEAGKALKTMDGEAAREITPEDLMAMDAETLSKTLSEAVREAEELAPQITDETERVALEVETGQIWRDFAHLLPEDERSEQAREVGRDRVRDMLVPEAAIATRGRLQEYEPDDDTRRTDLNQPSRIESPERETADPWVQVEAADAKVVAAYEARGLNGERAVARIIGGKEAEPETLQYWREEEIRERMREGDVPRAVATRDVDDLQKAASDAYREAERQIERSQERGQRNEIDRDGPVAARHSAEREAEVEGRDEGARTGEPTETPERDGSDGALEIVQIDPDTGRGLVSAKALREQVQRDAVEIAKAQAEKDRERGIDRGLDLDFD